MNVFLPLFFPVFLPLDFRLFLRRIFSSFSLTPFQSDVPKQARRLHLKNKAVGFPSESSLIWIRREICTDQATKQKQICWWHFDVRGQQGMVFFTWGSVIMDYGLGNVIWICFYSPQTNLHLGWPEGEYQDIYIFGWTVHLLKDCKKCSSLFIHDTWRFN